MTTFWNKELVKWPNGKTYTAEEVFGELGHLRAAENIVITTSNGIVQAMDDLEILKEIHGVTEADRDLALAEILDKIANPPPVMPEVSNELVLQSLNDLRADLEIGGVL